MTNQETRPSDTNGSGRFLMVLSLLAIGIGILVLTRLPDKPVTGQSIFLVWVYISLLGSSAYNAFRVQQKRIAALEEQLSTLTEGR
jgi:hypothetical protein